VKGVDSTAKSHEALHAAKSIAKKYGCVVAVSGATDLVRALGRLLLVGDWDCWAVGGQL